MAGVHGVWCWSNGKGRRCGLEVTSAMPSPKHRQSRQLELRRPEKPETLHHVLAVSLLFLRRTRGQTTAATGCRHPLFPFTASPPSPPCPPWPLSSFATSTSTHRRLTMPSLHLLLLPLRPLSWIGHQAICVFTMKNCSMPNGFPASLVSWA